MKQIEPIILAVALGILALGTGLLAWFYPSGPEITSVTTLEAKGVQVKPLAQDEIDSSLAIWNSPVVWQAPASGARLFQSDRYLFYPAVYPQGNYIVKVSTDSRSPSGVLLSWYDKYGLDIQDPNIDREDPDGDGFSNITEYKNEPVGQRIKASDCDGTKSCNPLDPKSHPDYLSRLRLQKYDAQPFHIQFKGYEALNGTTFFQLYLSDVDSAHQPPLKKTGDELGFEGWVIGPFTQSIKKEKDQGTGIIEDVDESTLELDKPDIGRKVIVPFRKEIIAPESTANFVMLMPADVDKVIKVPVGKVFTISYIPNKSYQVIDVDDNGATIRDTATKDEYHILRLDPAEWDEVPVPPATASNSGGNNGGQ